jgi:hypothetical protein
MAGGTASPVAPHFSYLPMAPVPRYWHFYLLENSPTGIRRFVQGRAYDLSGPVTTTGSDSHLAAYSDIVPL